MRHNHAGPFTVEVRSSWGCRNPYRETLPESAGIRKARELARKLAEGGSPGICFSRVFDGAGVPIFEVRNIAGKAQQVKA